MQVRDLALGLAEPHELHMGTPLKNVQVFLDGNPIFYSANFTTQLGLIHRLAEGTLNPTAYVVNKDVYMWDTTCH